MITGLLTVLGGFTVIFAGIFGKDLKDNKSDFKDADWLKLGGVGFITNFFDVLGIGSFSTATSLWKFFDLVEDRLIPGTLNVGHTIPVVYEAFLMITVIDVEPLTLVSMIVAATLGATLAAGVVARLPELHIKTGMGGALIVVALIMVAGQVGLMPVGGEALGLSGSKLIIAIVGNFILGAFMTIGVGMYAPCMALVSMLGMSPRLSFPIMMGSSAFVTPAAGIRFVKEGAYDRRASVASTVSGIVGITIAHFIVKELPITILTWLVICVILYTGIKMLKEVHEDKNNIIEPVLEE